MTRRSISNATRVRIFRDAGGVCHLCELKIDAPKQSWQVEHVKPLSMGGKDDETNMRPAHIECHAIKTAEEAGPRAKADAAGAKHLGLSRRPSTLKGAGFARFAPQRSASRKTNKWYGWGGSDDAA